MVLKCLRLVKVEYLSLDSCGAFHDRLNDTMVLVVLFLQEFQLVSFAYRRLTTDDCEDVQLTLVQLLTIFIILYIRLLNKFLLSNGCFLSKFAVTYCFL